MRPLLATCLLCSACTPDAGKVTVDLYRHAQAGETPLVSYAGGALSVGEVNRQLAALPPHARARFQTRAQQREYAEGLAQFDLLAVEAARRGLGNDPKVVDALKRALVERLLDEALEKTPVEVSDADLRAHYDAHHADYVKPEQVRLSHLFLAAPDADAAARGARRREAERLLAEARALPPLDYQAFGRLVKAHSDDAESQARDGDLRYQTYAALTERWGAAVADAARALTEVGQVSPAVVETPRGFHLLKLQGRQAALNLQPEQVQLQLRDQVTRERKRARYQALLETLRTQHGLRVHEDALAGVRVDPAAPAPQAGAPGAFPPLPVEGAAEPHAH